MREIGPCYDDYGCHEYECEIAEHKDANLKDEDDCNNCDDNVKMLHDSNAVNDTRDGDNKIL